MIVQKNVTIDLNRPRKNVVHLGQGDNTRQIHLTLQCDGSPYSVINDIGTQTLVKYVKYIKANGVGGLYDTTSTGVDAVAPYLGVLDNEWIVSIDEHATDVPGFAEIFVTFALETGEILHSFPITLDVVKNTAGTTDPDKPYYHSSTFIIAGAQATKTASMTQAVGIDANGKLWVPPGGGSGGAGLFVVTLDGQNVPDASSSDVYDAWNSGSICKLRTSVGIEYDLQSINASRVIFSTTVDAGSAVQADSYTLTGLSVTHAALSGYVKPAGGIPDSDMSGDVQAALSKAGMALQPGDQATKTSAMTQAVGVDANGKLWTTPGDAAVLFVTLSYSGGVYTTDTSAGDIYIAKQANKVIKLRDDLGIEYDLQSATSTTAIFSAAIDQSNAVGVISFQIVGTTVTRITHSAPVAPIPSASDNGKFLTVSGGAYALAELSSILRHDYVAPAIPSIVYMRSSDELKIFTRNLLRPSYALELGQYTTATDIRAHDDYTVIAPTTTGTKSIPFATFDEHMNQIDSESFSLVIASTDPGNKTMLAIGDSFLTQNVLVQRIWARYAQAGKTLTTLGTKGTAQVNYEGYAGKKWTDFWSGFSGSPFGESGFSFSAYMTAQGYSAPDYVYIQLGTNDASPTRWSSEQDLSGIITAARGIVDNIHSYASGIKIVLGLCVMPTLQGDKFAAKYNGVGWSWILRWNMQRLNKAIIDEFTSDANLRVAPVNLCLDSTADISDNVHPNTTGYNKMGDVVYSTMAGW